MVEIVIFNPFYILTQTLYSTITITKTAMHLFKASALWVDAFYNSCVCVSVRVSIRLFTFDVPFKRLFAPTSGICMSKILDIRNPWGKVMERSGLRFEHFCLEVV